MGIKTFNNGDVLTASDVNTYLMRQAVITATSAVRPSSPGEGMTIAETDTDRILTHDGSTWQPVGYYGDGEAYTPTITSNGTAPTMGGGITALGRYWRRGSRLIDVLIWIKIGSGWAAGTGSYAVSLPVAVNSTYNRHSLGFTFVDASGGFYRGFAHAGEDAAIGTTNLNTAKLYYHVNGADSYAGFTASAPVAPALNDIFEICGSYYV